MTRSTVDNDCVFGYFRVTIPSQQNSRKKYMASRVGYICIQLRRPPKNSMGEQEYEASFAFCSPLDQFNKKLARVIASQRMQIHHPQSTFKFMFNRTPTTKLNEVFQHALNIAFGKQKQSRGRWRGNGLEKPEIPFCPEWLTESDRQIQFGLHD